MPLVDPIFRLDGDTHKLAGVECLTRGPVGTPFHRADALFSYARRKRAEHIVDKHCISAALEAASAIPAPIRLSLNVHASTLGRCADFCGWLCMTAAENSIDPQRLTIEIVEHVPAWNKSEFFDSLAALRGAGMRIALDDVGLGHSNFQMMVDAKPDYFKRDRYFVHGCHRDKYRRAVVASVAKLAEELDSSSSRKVLKTRQTWRSYGTSVSRSSKVSCFAAPSDTISFGSRKSLAISVRALWSPGLRLHSAS